MSTATEQSAVTELLAKSQIADLLCRYARGIDRSDWELVRSCYHDDAFDDHGLVRAGRDEFVEYVRAFFTHVTASMHHLGNIIIDVQGDRASSESYAVCWHRHSSGDGALSDLLVGVRYVDEHEKRDGAWKILNRRVAFEWTRQDPVVAEMETTPAFIWGRKDRDDISYELLGQLKRE